MKKRSTNKLKVKKATIANFNEIKGGKEESSCSAIRRTELCHSRIDVCVPDDK